MFAILKKYSNHVYYKKGAMKEEAGREREEKEIRKKTSKFVLRAL